MSEYFFSEYIDEFKAEKVHSYVGGELIPGEGPVLEVKSPLSGKGFSYISESPEEVVDKAVKASSEAFKTWSSQTYKERAKYFVAFRKILSDSVDVLSKLITMESGKTFAEAKAEILKGIEVVDFALSLQNLSEGQASMMVSRGVHCSFMREPVGVCVGITPFNFPVMVPMWLFPIAIATGNTFILKPSEKVSRSAIELAKMMTLAGFPKGVFQVVTGMKKTSDQLVGHPLVKAVTFVGSTDVAKAVYEKSTAKHKRALCLGGAKNPVIVCEDADPEVAVRGVVDSFTGCAGQRCMAASLLYLVGGGPKVSEIFDKVKSEVARIRLGVDMGAIIDQMSKDRIQKIIARAEDQKHPVTYGNISTQPTKGGVWLPPAVIEGATSRDSFLVQTEIFGPVITVVEKRTLGEVMEEENAHPYGNAVSVFTTSGEAADIVIRRASAGMVGVNVGVPVPREPFSFGGRKFSKFGALDITGSSAVDFWTDKKKVTVKWEQSEKADWMS